MPPFLAQQRFRTVNAAAATPHAPAPPPVTINMSNLAQPTQTTEVDPNNPNKGKVETLFGPPVGVGGTPAPEWTVLAGKAELKDHGDEEEEELTMDVVQEWIRRNKEESAGDKPVATTTLQALVNLKRPSIKLTPLTIQPAASSSEETPQQAAATAAHGLEFDFDCDAARCAISIRAVVLASVATTSYPPATNEKDAKKKPETQWTTISLFDATIDGGFGKVFKFDEHGAVLELDKLDVAAAPAATPDADAKGAATNAAATPNAEGLTPAAAAAQNQHPHRKRFSAFHFRRRSMAQDAAGPALQVVDADAEAQAAAARHAAASEAADQDEDHPAPQAANQAGASKPAVSDAGDDSGAKVVIRLEALDEHDKPLGSRNAQLTYLHILRMAAPSESTPASEEPSTTHRPWVVKVVKREAVIGSHTFRLQEIYGLASSSSSSNNYPPNTTPTVDQNDAPATECVLCLSSPREVVLLPCRHLVACRECAVNMVEFGAGGQLTHEAEGTTAAAATTTGGAAEGAAVDGANGTENQAAGATGATEQPRPRRKRKAKGWFCPVCRQPYTALLRITTTPPGKRFSEDSFHAPLPASVPVIPTPPPAAHIAPTSQAADATIATATATTAPAGTTTEESGSAGAGKLSGLLGSLSLRGKKGDAVQPSGSDAV